MIKNSISLTSKLQTKISPKILRSLNFLKLNELQLNEVIKKEVNDNPFLEYSFFKSHKNKEYVSLDKVENIYSHSHTFKMLLFQKLGEIKTKKHIEFIAKYIIENINNMGFLNLRIEEIALSLKIHFSQIKEAFDIVQNLEPIGTASYNLEEYLFFQIEKKFNQSEADILKTILKKCFIKNESYSKIIKELNLSKAKLNFYLNRLRTLHPYPSFGYPTSKILEKNYLYPSASVTIENNNIFISFLVEPISRIKLSSNSEAIFKTALSSEDRDLLKEQFTAAKEFINLIEFRGNTFKRTIEEICLKQTDFLLYDATLQPLTLKDISFSLNLHISTLSRCIKGKYISIPNGKLIPLKSLFSKPIAGTSRDTIEYNIFKIIDQNPNITDSKICEKLKNLNINISRKTVGNYRKKIKYQN